MAFGSTAKVSSPKKLANIDKNDLNSNQESVPVPYAAGRREYINLHSQPGYSGPVKAKREWADSNGILPGSLIKLDSGTYGLEIICRVLETTYPEAKAGEVELSLESERGLYPTIYYPVPPARVPDFFVVAAKVVHARVVALPSGLKDAAGAEVGFLAERPDPTLTGYHIYLSRDGASYDPLLAEASWAVRGVLTADYSATTADVDESAGLQVLMDGTDVDQVTSQSDAQRDGDNLLIFLGAEILSAGEIVVTGPNQFEVLARRGICGTTKAAHPAGAEVW